VESYSQSHSSSLLRITEGEKSSGKPWDGSGSNWFSVRTMKALLIGQSVTREKYDVPKISDFPSPVSKTLAHPSLNIQQLR